MGGFNSRHGSEVEGQLRMEVEDLRPAYDTIWHRLADLKRQIQRCLTRYDSAPGTATAGEYLAKDLRAVIVEAGQRPHVPSPHELRAKHNRGRTLIAENEATDDDGDRTRAGAQP